MAIDSYRRRTLRQTIEVIGCDLVEVGRRYVLFMLGGALMEALHGACHPFLRELAGLGRVVKAFTGFIRAKVGQGVLLLLLVEVFTLDQRVVYFSYFCPRLDNIVCQ